MLAFCPPYPQLEAVMNHGLNEGRHSSEAAMARPHGCLVAPHNWGSLAAFYMILHVGRAIPNFYRAEDDPLDTDVLVADGYAIKGGLDDRINAAIEDDPTIADEIPGGGDLKVDA